MTNLPDSPHSFRIDARPLPVEQRIALGNAFVLPGFEVGPVPGHPDRVNGCADVWMFDRLTAARNTGLVCRFRRGIDAAVPPGAAGADDPTLRLRMITAGEIDGIVDGEPMRFRPGDIVLHANDVPIALDLVELDCLTFGFSAATIGLAQGGPFGIARFEAASGAGAMLAGLFRAFFDRIADVERDEAEAMATACVAMLGGLGAMLGRQSHTDGTDRAADMRAFIKQNLADPELGIASITDRFPASRAVIYRAFGPDGGVSAYIARQRMRRALSLLTLSGETCSVSEVARAVGYTSQRRFSRTFARQFGVSPSSARAAFADLKSVPAPCGGRGEADGTRFRGMLDHSEAR